MDRRDNRRQARRLQVEFSEGREGEVKSGYSINISPTGMFIGTSTPLPRGTRIRVEFLHPEHGFVAEGVVVHAAKVTPMLQKLRPSGMGVHFLSFEELATPFLPAFGPTGPAAGEGDARAQPAAPETEEEKKRRRRRWEQEEAYPVRFRTPEEFLQVFSRDIENGGLFISTQRPADLDEEVTVELQLPTAHRPLTFPARVVHRIEPRKSAAGAGLAGMGVEFSDPDEVLRQLRPVAEELAAGINGSASGP